MTGEDPPTTACSTCVGHVRCTAEVAWWSVCLFVSLYRSHLVKGVQDHIKSLNWGHRVQLKERCGMGGGGEGRGGEERRVIVDLVAHQVAMPCVYSRDVAYVNGLGSFRDSHSVEAMLRGGETVRSVLDVILQALAH